MERDKKNDLFYLTDEEKRLFAEVIDNGTPISRSKAEAILTHPSVPGFVIRKTVQEKIVPLAEERPELRQIVSEFEKTDSTS